MEQGKQFLGMPKVVSDQKRTFPKYVNHYGLADVNYRQLTLSNVGQKEPLSTIYYGTTEEHPDIKKIDLLTANEEGKGHTQTLLHHLYQDPSTKIVDWGEITHPASEHMYHKFSNEYGNSRSWVDRFPDDDHEEDAGW